MLEDFKKFAMRGNVMDLAVHDQARRSARGAFPPTREEILLAEIRDLLARKA